MAITKKMVNGKAEYRLDGKKLYPICSWEKNQHKIYNALDRASLRRMDEDYSEESEQWYAKCYHAVEIVDGIVISGIVYGLWEDYKFLKSLIGGYDVRHC